MAKKSTKDFEGALADITKAMELRPTDKTIIEDYQAIKAA